MLVGPEAQPVTNEAVRDRRRSGRLVGFKTTDGRLAWPAWQFRRSGGRLVVDESVIKLWRLLPWERSSQLELITWMTGARRDLDGLSPVRYVRERDVDSQVWQAASRLRGRLAT